ncbi:peptidoglycan-binding protein [Streptomyces sp. NPDC048305]|uniref:peptidoglycan-binding protein n=1 Tax=Streptomyces sp. NPDC048305 TaxID=3365532 RepID=UPI003716D106
MTAHIYPKADASSQWFHAAYQGDTMPHPNVIVLHTTEGSSFPSYGGGGSAPTFTIKGGTVRQHFYANESARALVNAAGGVQTNTLNAVQIELVGTCDKGGPGLYWPDADDADLAALADLVKWLTDTYPIPVVSTSKPWLAYPSSYGSARGQRMSFSEWENFNGICGHMHVPENDHGDPGNFPIKRLIELVKGAKPSTGGGTTAPATPSWDGKSFPGASAFVLGKSHPAVTVLGQRLVAHGYGSFYKEGPGPTFGQADKNATQAFQKAQGWSGGDADGYPGAETWSRLMAAPKAAATSTIVALSSAVKPGAKHAQVKELQQLLLKAGYGPIPGALSTYYGPETQKAVARFHNKNPKLKSAGKSYDPAIGKSGFVELQKEAGRK